MKRFKSVYSSHRTLANAWADGTLSPHGDSFTANNMLCDHRKIYSWGTHFCIAEKLDGGIVLLTERTRSNSTAKHKSIVQRAVFRSSTPKHLIMFVPNLDNGNNRNNPDDWMRDTLNQARTMFHNAKRARSLRPYKIAESVQLFNRAASYAKMFDRPFPTPAALPPGYLDFLAVESFKAKADQPASEPFPTLHPCYTETRYAIAA